MMISFSEEIVFYHGLILFEKIFEFAELFGMGSYGQHLKNVADGIFVY